MLEAPSPALITKVSMPEPPARWSLPVPPSKVSSPLAPINTSSPAPPLSVWLAVSLNCVIKFRELDKLLPDAGVTSQSLSEPPSVLLHANRKSLPALPLSVFDTPLQFKEP